MVNSSYSLSLTNLAMCGARVASDHDMAATAAKAAELRYRAHRGTSSIRRSVGTAMARDANAKVVTTLFTIE